MDAQLAETTTRPAGRSTWGRISGHRLVAGRCGWSPDGIHYYYQVRAAVVAALLKGIDPNDVCGLADPRDNPNSTAQSANTSLRIWLASLRNDATRPRLLFRQVD